MKRKKCEHSISEAEVQEIGDGTWVEFSFECNRCGRRGTAELGYGDLEWDHDDEDDEEVEEITYVVVGRGYVWAADCTVEGVVGQMMGVLHPDYIKSLPTNQNMGAVFFVAFASKELAAEIRRKGIGAGLKVICEQGSRPFAELAGE